ncbi:MAG: type II toxin-antitoxin system PemK/MazF family toxin [bacterium]|nr:type II toxin-antitoxin system PemK/MazF family toxin [bacterium]
MTGQPSCRRRTSRSWSTLTPASRSAGTLAKVCTRSAGKARSRYRRLHQPGPRGPLYPALAPGNSGLRKRSFALVDQLRSVDKRRVRRSLGRISDSELAAIDKGLRLYLGLTEPPKIPKTAA